MPMAKLEKTFVRLRSQSTGEWFVDPALRGMLIAEAAAANTSMSDLASEIIAKRFGMLYETRGRRTRPTGDDDEKLLLYMPIELRRALRTAANANDSREFDVIRETLSAHYGLPMPGNIAA